MIEENNNKIMVNSIYAVNSAYTDTYRLNYNATQNSNINNYESINTEAENSDNKTSEDKISFFSPREKVISYLKSDISSRYGINMDELFSKSKNLKNTNSSVKTKTTNKPTSTAQSKSSQTLLIEYLLSGLNTNSQSTIRQIGTDDNSTTSATNSLNGLITYLKSGINSSYYTLANNLKTNATAYNSGLTP